MTNVKTLEQLFIQEFNANTRKQGDKNINNVPLPILVDSWEVSNAEQYAIKGIDNIYSGLNKTIVSALPRNKQVRKRVIDKSKSREGSFRFLKNEDGTFVTKDYSKPTGSRIVISERDLQLPFRAFNETIDGFDYIDFSKMGKKRVYIYAVPDKYLYKVNQTALALSVKTMVSYSGYGYKTWSNGVIYLCVIPYNPNAKYEATKILKTGHTLNYSSEIKAISNYWEGINFMPNIDLSALQDGSNLALKSVTISTKQYMPVNYLPLNKKELFGDEETI